MRAEAGPNHLVRMCFSSRQLGSAPAPQPKPVLQSGHEDLKSGAWEIHTAQSSWKSQRHCMRKHYALDLPPTHGTYPMYTCMQQVGVHKHQLVDSDGNFPRCLSSFCIPNSLCQLDIHRTATVPCTLIKLADHSDSPCACLCIQQAETDWSFDPFELAEASQQRPLSMLGFHLIQVKQQTLAHVSEAMLLPIKTCLCKTIHASSFQKSVWPPGCTKHKTLTRDILVLQRAGLANSLHFSEERLATFLLGIESGYKTQDDMPYHNR